LVLILLPEFEPLEKSEFLKENVCVWMVITQFLVRFGAQTRNAQMVYSKLN
jgi:hypothetical protein